MRPRPFIHFPGPVTLEQKCVSAVVHYYLIKILFKGKTIYQSSYLTFYLALELGMSLGLSNDSSPSKFIFHSRGLQVFIPILWWSISPSSARLFYTLPWPLSSFQSGPMNCLWLKSINHSLDMTHLTKYFIYNKLDL